MQEQIFRRAVPYDPFRGRLLKNNFINMNAKNDPERAPDVYEFHKLVI